MKWKRAKKTKGLKAKPMVNLIVDKGVMRKFLVDTLEAREPIAANAMFCIGEAGDAWQQTPQALLKKYDVRDIDDDGWMICEPKPDNEVEFYESDKDCLITGVWGEIIDGKENQQRCSKGDFILRNPMDTIDIWVVQRKLFLNTYSELGTK